MSLSKGTPVEWNTPQGPTHGRIVQKYVVESAKTGARTAHKASALTVKK